MVKNSSSTNAKKAHSPFQKHLRYTHASPLEC